MIGKRARMSPSDEWRGAVKLWRPVGKTELEKIEAAGMKGFPARLPEHPVSCPVLSFGYAEKIARDWNSTRSDHDHLGFVTAFELDDGFAESFEANEAGGTAHRELWIPATEMEALNNNLLGPIEVVASYRKGERIR